jgi:hypothetical protein
MDMERASITSDGTDTRIVHWSGMERIFLVIICSSVVLLTTAIGLASPPAKHEDLTQRLPLLLRIVPS